MNTNAGSKATPLMDGRNKQLKNILSELKKINIGFNSFQVIRRGFLNGIATGIGATVGLALLLFLITQLLSYFSYVPFINEILTITKLNKVIETKAPITDNSAPTPTTE